MDRKDPPESLPAINGHNEKKICTFKGSAVQAPGIDTYVCGFSQVQRENRAGVL